MVDNWGIDTSELDALVEQLDHAGADLERIARKAVDASVPIVRSEMSRLMPKSETPRQPSINIKTGGIREKWRTGRHAAEDIEAGKPKLSLRGSLYRVIGPSTGDNSPHFYMKFFEYGRGVYNRRTGRVEGRQEPDSYVEPTVNAVRGKVIETIKDALLKGLGL